MKLTCRIASHSQSVSVEHLLHVVEVVARTSPRGKSVAGTSTRCASGWRAVRSVVIDVVMSEHHSNETVTFSPPTSGPAWTPATWWRPWFLADRTAWEGVVVRGGGGRGAGLSHRERGAADGPSLADGVQCRLAPRCNATVPGERYCAAGVGRDQPTFSDAPKLSKRSCWTPPLTSTVNMWPLDFLVGRIRGQKGMVRASWSLRWCR